MRQSAAAHGARARAEAGTLHVAAGRCRGGAEPVLGWQVNPVIQLAAALDRRGVMVSINGGSRLLVHLGGYRERIVISRQVRGVALCDIGKTWLWEHGGKSGTHPADDPEGAATAIEAFLRADPGGELPASKRGLEIVLAEYRRALHNLITAADQALIQPSLN